jgi:hypothetical protein
MFAVVSMLLMAVTAISISYNGWLAVLMFLLTICSIAAGFITKARLRKKREQQE